MKCFTSERCMYIFFIAVVHVPRTLCFVECAEGGPKIPKHHVNDGTRQRPCAARRKRHQAYAADKCGRFFISLLSLPKTHRKRSNNHRGTRVRDALLLLAPAETTGEECLVSSARCLGFWGVQNIFADRNSRRRRCRHHDVTVTLLRLMCVAIRPLAETIMTKLHRSGIVDLA